MKITVTAGHGGSDPGATGNSLIEREVMAELRDIVAKKLTAAGHTVRTDGEPRHNLPLAHALTLAPGSDVAIELHTNAAANQYANGVEVVARAADKARAQAIAQSIARVLGSRVRADSGWYDAEQHRIDRGWRSQAAFVRAGGMIVEVFFISNPDECVRYLSRTWLVASAIAAAVSA